MNREDIIINMIETQGKVLNILNFNIDNVVRYTRSSPDPIRIKDSVVHGSYGVFYLINDNVRFRMGDVQSTFEGCTYSAILFGNGKNKLQRLTKNKTNNGHRWRLIKEAKTIRELIAYTNNIDRLIQVL